MDIKPYGWQRGYGWSLSWDRDNVDLGYSWEVFVETADAKHIRASTVRKPHKQAVRNAKDAMRRLKRKLEGKK
jgi:hypothetical protein